MNKKAITIAFLNIRSLGRNYPKQKEIRTWVTSLATPSQFLLIQEQHLGEVDSLNSSKGAEF
jgi:hypothetical protein